MSEDLENLSREELIELIKKQENKMTVHPNSLASVLMMDGKEAHKHYVKNVMPTPMKWFGVIVGSFVALVFLTFGILFISL